MVILSLLTTNFKHHGMSFARRQVGPSMKYSILDSKNESDPPFPYSILSHFSGIPQIYKTAAKLPHHTLFRFTRIVVKNFDT